MNPLVSSISKVFSLPGNPSLPDSHPMNQILSPFLPDRRKVSWYLKRTLVLEPVKILLGSEKNKNREEKKDESKEEGSKKEEKVEEKLEENVEQNEVKREESSENKNNIHKKAIAFAFSRSLFPSIDGIVSCGLRIRPPPLPQEENGGQMRSFKNKKMPRFQRVYSWNPRSECSFGEKEWQSNPKEWEGVSIVGVAALENHRSVDLEKLIVWQTLGSSDDVELETRIQQNWLQERVRRGEASQLFSPPWFYQSISNRFFSSSLLKEEKKALVHLFVPRDLDEEEKTRFCCPMAAALHRWNDAVTFEENAENAKRREKKDKESFHENNEEEINREEKIDEEEEQEINREEKLDEEEEQEKCCNAAYFFECLAKGIRLSEYEREHFEAIAQPLTSISMHAAGLPPAVNRSFLISEWTPHLSALFANSPLHGVDKNYSIQAIIQAPLLSADLYGFAWRVVRRRKNKEFKEPNETFCAEWMARKGYIRFSHREEMVDEFPDEWNLSMENSSSHDSFLKERTTNLSNMENYSQKEETCSNKTEKKKIKKNNSRIIPTRVLQQETIPANNVTTLSQRRKKDDFLNRSQWRIWSTIEGFPPLFPPPLLGSSKIPHGKGPELCVSIDSRDLPKSYAALSYFYDWELEVKFVTLHVFSTIF